MQSNNEDQILLSQGNEQPILLAQLAREEQLDQWFDFVTSIFAPKAQRAYFERHFYSDPFREVNSIFVARDRHGDILSTVRVFHRKIVTCNYSVKRMGGVGEVCTRADMRGKGIASSLLRKSLVYMKQSGQFDLSSLHCANSLVPFYETVGFYSVPCYYSMIKIRIERLLEVDVSDFTFAEPDFKQPSTIEQLSSIYQEFIREQQFCGVLAREDPQYWKLWVAAEWYTYNSTSIAALYSENNKIIAYLVIHPKGKDATEFNIKEFAASGTQDYCKLFFELLGRYMFNRQQDLMYIMITLPFPLLKALNINLTRNNGNSEHFKFIIEEIWEKKVTDLGFMYQTFAHNNGEEKHKIMDLFPEEKHICWKTDGF